MPASSSSGQSTGFAAHAATVAGAVGKFAIILTLATAVTTLLFKFNTILVSRPAHYDTGYAGAKVVEFVRVEQDDYVRTKERRLPIKPKEPDRPPPPPRMRVNTDAKVEAVSVDIDVSDIEMNFGAGGGPYLGRWYGQSAPGAPDSDVVPIVRISPQYPRKALLDGEEGWVQIEFTITPDGRVIDPVVVASEPRGVFERAAMQAIIRWKFRPRYVDGEAITRRASQVIDFRLEG